MTTIQPQQQKHNKFPTVLVCGGAGYIGSHTALELLRTRQYNVVIFDNFSTGYHQAVSALQEIFDKELKTEEEGVFFEVVEGEVGNEEHLNKTFSAYKIDAVMHFCALIVVPESVVDPLKYYENNTVATLRLLKQMNAHKVRNIIFASTAALFGKPKRIPIEPEDETIPINPYGDTKLAVENIFKWCDPAYGLRYVSLRFFNACGADVSGKLGEAHEPESHLIPIILQVPLGQRQHITVYGKDYATKDGTCIRDYVHVTDLASAHIGALQYLLKGGKSDVFNLGSGCGNSVTEVVEACRKVTGHAIPLVFAERRAGDPAELTASPTKAEKVLGWTRKFETIEEIVASAWKWHSSHPKGWKQE